MNYRIAIALAGALSLSAGASLAALGTTQFGLPQNWSMTTGHGYGAQTGVNGNPGSAMCVECHTVNPSSRINVPSQLGSLLVSRSSLAHQGSHFVMNVQAGAANAPWGITSSGGGFPGGYTSAQRDGGQYFRKGAWASGGFSKYNTGTTLASAVEPAGGFTAGDAATKDLVCESCHNLVVNTVNTLPKNKLLLGVYREHVADGICTGCHAQDETGAGRQAFHGNDMLAAFAGTNVRKRHHVMTGDSLVDTLYGATGASSIMWAPSASTRLHSTWCTTKFANVVAPFVDLNLVAGVGIAFRDVCNVAGSGTRAYTAVNGSGDIAPTGANAVNCSNCHRPHNAMSTAGAFILRQGSTAKGDFGGNVGTGKFAGQTNANIMYGMRRQVDVGDHTTTKVYRDYAPLCAGCHHGY